MIESIEGIGMQSQHIHLLVLPKQPQNHSFPIFGGSLDLTFEFVLPEMGYQTMMQSPFDTLRLNLK